MNRFAVLAASAVAAASLSSCKKVEPVTAAPLPPPGAPAGGMPSAPPPGMPPQAMPPSMPPPGMPAGVPPSVGQPAHAALEQQIAFMKKLVDQDPKNVRAWISLGDAYFDSHRHVESIEAYDRALALDPNNPDVLTDQGVMYRELKQPEKAIANFTKANKINPRHLQSLMNIGVVQAYDLKNPAKAVEAWNKVIATDPSSPLAAQAREAIASLQSGR